MESALDRLAGIFDDMAGAAGGADLADDGEDDVLGGDAVGQRAVDAHRACSWPSSGSASGWRARARPRSCRCRSASAPKAPWVEVWLSPQTMVVPGSVKPCSGPITCTMPWRRSRSSVIFDAEVARVLGERLRSAARALRIVDALDAVGRRHVVIDHGERLLRAAHLAAPPCAGPRTPAGSSPHARGGGRYRSGRCRQAPRAPGARPRSCRTACGVWPFSVDRQNLHFQHVR